jgi:hypothetical protein
MCDAEGRKTSWEANCVNPFSKVGVRAAQDGGAHLEKNKFRWMVQQYYAQTPDGKARHRSTFLLWLFDGPLQYSTLPQDVIYFFKSGVGLCLFACFKTKLLDSFISSLKKPEGKKNGCFMTGIAGQA